MTKSASMMRFGRLIGQRFTNWGKTPSCEASYQGTTSRVAEKLSAYEILEGLSFSSAIHAPYFWHTEGEIGRAHV